MAVLDVLASSLTICLIVAGGLASSDPPIASTPEGKAVAFLIREVPRWSRENHCYSCHNNGDAARALYQAARAGYSVPEEALAETTRWLIRPESWDHNGGDGPISDKRLARVAFTTTLTTAIGTGRVVDRSVLMRAAERLALDQAADGSWPLDGEDATGSPATYGRMLATFLARGSLFAAQPTHFRAAIERADRWLLSRDVSNVTEASVSLLTSAVVQSPENADRATTEPRAASTGPVRRWRMGALASSLRPNRSIRPWCFWACRNVTSRPWSAVCRREAGVS